MESALADNYIYWQKSGQGWFAEYNRRKRTGLYFHIQELFVTEYISRHAPARVLEYGCGVGRHLSNLRQLPDVEVFGYDQSPTMVAEMEHWATRDWVEKHVRVGEPVGRLPFGDGEFDLVFTSEALVHSRPEDLGAILSELIRVSRRKILHLEPPPDSELISEAHNGCWGHNLAAAYQLLGKKAEELPRLYKSQTVVEVSTGEETFTNPVFTLVGSRVLERMEEDITPLLNRGVWEDNLSSQDDTLHEINTERLVELTASSLHDQVGSTSRARLQSLIIHLVGKVRDLSEALSTQAQEAASWQHSYNSLAEENTRITARLSDVVSQHVDKPLPSIHDQGLDRHDDLETVVAAFRQALQERTAAQLELDLQREATSTIEEERTLLMRKLRSIENKLEFIETRTSYSKIQKIRRSRSISSLLSRLGIVSHPVVVEVLPESNSLSRGREVWLRWIRPDPEAPTLPWSMVSLQDGWQRTNSVGCTDNSALLGRAGKLVLSGGRDPLLNFMAHPWSGRVRLTWNGHQRDLDLFSPEPTDITVRLCQQ